jgi:WD40 repeat protein
LSVLNHLLTITSASFSPDESKILTVSTDNFLTLWNTDGSIITKINVGNSLNSCQFSPDGGRFIIGFLNGSSNIYFLKPSDIYATMQNIFFYNLSTNQKDDLNINN